VAGGSALTSAPTSLAPSSPSLSRALSRSTLPRPAVPRRRPRSLPRCRPLLASCATAPTHRSRHPLHSPPAPGPASRSRPATHPTAGASRNHRQRGRQPRVWPRAGGPACPAPPAEVLRREVRAAELSRTGDNSIFLVKLVDVVSKLI
jgi:hypothetical protein